MTSRERQAPVVARSPALYPRAVFRLPENVGARVLLGRVLLDHGIGTEAVEHLEAAARLSPEDADIHDLLARAFQDLGRDDQARRRLETASKIRAEN